MTKKSEKKAKNGMYTLIASILSFIGLALGGAAAFLPLWLAVPAQTSLGWPMRNYGLLKLSGMFTNTVLTMADMTWAEVKAAVCDVASAQGNTMAMTGTAALTKAMTAAAGATCKDACKSNLFTRCTVYGHMQYVGFAVAGCLVLGGLMALIGALLPYFGKERKGDKWMNFIIIFIGALISSAGSLIYYFMSTSVINKILASSWYPTTRMGGSFYMAIGAGCCLILASLSQLAKALGDGADKAKVDPAADPAALDPTLIDPTLL